MSLGQLARSLKESATLTLNETAAQLREREPIIHLGGPFMVHHPPAYAALLKNKIEKHQADVWVVSTGWTRGCFGIGKRIGIRYTRALLNAALSGSRVKLLIAKTRCSPSTRRPTATGYLAQP